MFKFNFNNIENVDQPSIEEKQNTSDQHNYVPSNNEKETQKIDSGVFCYDDLNTSKKKSFVKSEIFFKKFFLNESPKEKKPSSLDYVDACRLDIDENDSLSKINKTHDLVAGRYEGGLKVWELSLDLARFIYKVNFYPLDAHKNMFTDSETYSNLNSVKFFFENFSNFILNFISGTQNDSELDLKILELGCGHALPALSVIKLLQDLIETKLEKFGSKVEWNEKEEKNIDKKFNLNIIVYMQDFNKQILEGVTFENSKKLLEQIFDSISFCHNNLNYKINLNKCFKFVFGDWRDILEKNLLPKEYFNLILTSETIYNSQNYKPLISLFKECLCRINTNNIKSLILLSAKTYYFGCGGNLYEFLSLIKSEYGEFEFSKNLLFDFILNYSKHNSLEKNSPNSDNHISIETPFDKDDSELYSANISKEIIKICFKN